MEIGQSGWKALRTSAIGMIDRFGDVTCVPVLLKAAADDDADLSKTAKAPLRVLAARKLMPTSSGDSDNPVGAIARC